MVSSSIAVCAQINLTVKNKKTLFNEILDGSKGSIYRICTAYLADPEHRNDLYQEILIAIWHSMDRFEGQSKWNTFIYRIAVNTAIKYCLKIKKENQMISRSEIPDIPAERDQDLEPMIQKMLNCIQLMADNERILLGLVLENLSYKEIAEVLGTDVNHVGVRINRAKKKLLELMKNNHG